MSWMQKLHATYEHCYGNPLFSDEEHVLMPVSHTSQNVNIKVVLDKDGNFKRAELLGKEMLVIPATEDSAGRSGTKPPPHPLIDKIRYCAGDYVDFGGQKAAFFAPYKKLLQQWAESEYSHPKVRAVYAYVVKEELVNDLVEKAKILELDENGKLSQKPNSETTQALFKLLAGDKDSGDALVCWSVEGVGPNADTWNDPELQQAWIAYDVSQNTTKSLCMVVGDTAIVASKHPKFIRRPGDGAKLISSNDMSGFTFRGKFELPDEACTVGYETSHKAHNALRWLIARQGSRQGDQVVLAWAVAGEDIPNPVGDIWSPEPSESDLVSSIEEASESAVSHAVDVGQSFSKELGKALAGYVTKLKPTDEIVILGLDSATPGRLSVVFYCELLWADYLSALKAWQEDCAWLLRKNTEREVDGKNKRVVFSQNCAPLPIEIAFAVYGLRVDDKLKAATRERLLPCIANRSPLPRDLMESAVRRASNRVGLEAWDWEHTLGVACALYRGFYARHPETEKRRKYVMALEPERTTRDYLYGRLLAVAERIESVALRIAKEERPTNAERLMQRFADHPFSTWNILEKALQPYRQRLRQRRAGFLYNMDTLLNEIQAMFATDDFISDKKLSGEFLLGYHCQRQVFLSKKSGSAENKETDTYETTEGEE